MKNTCIMLVTFTVIMTSAWTSVFAQTSVSAAGIVSQQSDTTFRLGCHSSATPPLILVDGLEVPDSILAKLNTEDLKSFSVLEEEESVKTYGERAVNGVIIITTKLNRSDLMNKLQAERTITVPHHTDTTFRLGCHSSATFPLILVDGLEVSCFVLSKLNPKDIEKFSILKDNKALEAYGERGANGVIIITTKPRSADLMNKLPDGSTDTTFCIGCDSSAPLPLTPLILIDGLETSNSVLSKLNPRDIESISILKDDKALEAYGTRGANGVVIVTTKSHKEAGKSWFPASLTDALILIDGQEVPYDKLMQMPTEDIESISILKDIKAQEAYGERGAHGVVIVTTKSHKEEGGLHLRPSMTDALILVDGQEVTREVFAQMLPEDIKSFSILRDNRALEAYGTRGANGVVIVTTKSHKIIR